MPSRAPPGDEHAQAHELPRLLPGAMTVAGGAGSQPVRRRARHRARRSPVRAAVFALLVAVVTVVGLAIALGTEQVDTAAEDVGRVGGAFPAEVGRPPATTPEALTFLVIGVDASDARTGEPRAEAVSLVRLTGDRQHVQGVTLAPDTWVEDAETTVEEAFDAAGPQGAVEAVEALSGVRIDHYAELDFAGLAEVVEALGGISVDVPAAYRSRGHSFAPEAQPFDGAEAVAYVRDVDVASRSGAPQRYQG